jgi:DNA-binding GntR family transcriptional regulator
MNRVADGNNDGEALYRRLAAQLRREIESGVLEANSMLASERDLAVKLGVSRETVRKALRLLDREGAVYSEQGRGTFVAPPAVRAMARVLDGFTSDARRRGDEPGQIILAVEDVPASTAIAGVLDIAPRRPVTRVKRIRTLNGQRIGTQESFLALPGTFSADDLQAAGSLYALIDGRFSISATEGLENVGAAAANADDAALLGIPVGAPVLVCERVTLSERRQPFEYCEMRYVSSYRYTARINRSGQARS